MAKKANRNRLEQIYSIYEQNQSEEDASTQTTDEQEEIPVEAQPRIDPLISRLQRLGIQQGTDGALVQKPAPAQRYDNGKEEKDAKGTPQESPKSSTHPAEEKREDLAKNPSPDTSAYRSPICCILGHADTGKTKILDSIRQTSVQLSEAGGITQQIGATYIPASQLHKKYGISAKHIPGILVIDTPGHEAFSNLRARGSSMCNLVVLVVDIMHGVEMQTKESLRLLRARKTPFIIALNKVDRIHGWKSVGEACSIRKQQKSAQLEFKQRYDAVVLSLAEEGINAALYLKNPDPKTYVSIVPTSATTGEGIVDLLSLLVSLVETKMLRRVKFAEGVECTVLEARAEEGKAPFVDVILSNGILREGDRIVLCSRSGAVNTVIKKLLTPKPMKDSRVKTQYTDNREVRAAAGVRLVAPGLDGALAGSKVYLVEKEEETEEIKRKAEEEMRITVSGLLSGTASEDAASGGTIFDAIGEDGVHVQASTLGSLEALVQILRSEKIPIRTVGVGSITKKDIVRTSTIRERRPEYAVMLCFDLTPSAEAQSIAKEYEVTVTTADIVYHLAEKFREHMREHWEKAAAALKEKVVFPCILAIIPGCVFTRRSPLVLGVRVVAGTLRLGTPLVVVKEEGTVSVGKITSILEDTKNSPRTDKLPAGTRASVKIEVSPNAAPVIIGRKVLETDELVSRLTRESIDLLKENFRDALSKEEWMTVIKIKKMLGIL